MEQRTLEINGKIFYCYSDGSVEFLRNARNWSKLKRTFGYPGNNGYLRLQMDKTYLVHRLIAMAFLPNPEHKPEVDHINRNVTDNRPENLRWVSRAENMHNSTKSINAIKKYGFQPKDDIKRWSKLYHDEYGKMYRATHVKLNILQPNGKLSSRNFSSVKDKNYILLKPLSPADRYKKCLELGI